MAISSSYAKLSIFNTSRYHKLGGIVVIGIITYSFHLFMRWGKRKMVPWKGKG
jgi:hypothetical protein